jgi:hypothetical protein
VESNQFISDINDAKGFINRDDLYSPSNQQLAIEVSFDNGNTNFNYNFEKNERISIKNEHNEQVNINIINSVWFLLNI